MATVPHTEISDPTRDEKKKIDPATSARQSPILLPSYFFATVPPYHLANHLLSTNIKPPNIKPPTVLTIPTFLSPPPHYYFNSVSFYLCFPFFLTLCLTLFLPPTLCEISTNLCRISINLFLLRLAMSRFLLFLDIAEPTKKTH